MQLDVINGDIFLTTGLSFCSGKSLPFGLKVSAATATVTKPAKHEESCNTLAAICPVQKRQGEDYCSDQLFSPPEVGS